MHTNTVILFGGNSDERRVSVASAQNIARECAGARLWFWSTSGEVVECRAAELYSHLRPFEIDFKPASPAIHRSLDEALDAVAPDLVPLAPVFFLALHGGEGEDGTVQRKMEDRRLAFTGSGAKASRLAFDKPRAKEVARREGVRVCSEVILGRKNFSDARREVAALFQSHPDLILKPVTGGSSIGLYRVRDEGRLDAVLAELEGRKGVDYLVEPFVTGREITVGVYDPGEAARALPPSEVRTAADRDFDYEGKYLGKGCEELTPAPLAPAETDACQRVALTLHHALGCDGYSRTDLILAPDGPVYLETNTLPGLSRPSFIPQQLAAHHLPFREFIEAQLRLATRRARAMG